MIQHSTPKYAAPSNSGPSVIFIPKFSLIPMLHLAHNGTCPKLNSCEDSPGTRLALFDDGSSSFCCLSLWGMDYLLIVGLLLAGSGVGAALTTAVYLAELKKIKTALQASAGSQDGSQVSSGFEGCP